jgi:hypothetical protein
MILRMLYRKNIKFHKAVSGEQSTHTAQTVKKSAEKL